MSKLVKNQLEVKIVSSHYSSVMSAFFRLVGYTNKSQTSLHSNSMTYNPRLFNLIDTHTVHEGEEISHK